MAARSSQEEQKARRRKRLLKGLLLGGAAVGLPALANALIARRSARLAGPGWGRSHRFAWSRGEIAYQRLGKGEPLLLIHSFGPGHDSEEWRAAAESLARTHQVFAPDLLGWGRSDKPRRAYDGELYLKLISGFLEDVVQKRCAVAAAGLPAAYALQVAADRPELIRALALVGPAGMDIHCEEPDLKDALLHRALQWPILGTSAMNLYTSRASVQHYLRRDVFAYDERVDAALLDHHYRSSHQPGSQVALAAYLSGYLNLRAEEALSRCNLPLWLAWGRQAKAPPVESADLWLQRAPQAQLEVFDRCGALPHLEVPGRFSSKLRRFLSTLST